MSTDSRDAPVLSIRNLSIGFRTGGQLVPAVRDVSIHVMAGETVAVVGESGSGKSTTAAAVNGLLPENAVISSGTIEFDRRDIRTLGERELVAIRGAGIGLVPQDPMSNLNPLMRVGEQIGEALEVHGRTSGRATTERVHELLEMVGISDPVRRARQYPHEFSGGMRQRVLIAIGLACDPRLLIADEPTSALDVTVQRRILDRLGSLTSGSGTALFLITHDLALAAERADRVVVMHRGRIVEQGPSAEVLRTPTHDYTCALIAAVPGLALARATRTREPAAQEGSPLISVRHVVKEYVLRGRSSGTFRAVDDVSFDIRSGTTVSLVGESGSGKSTTANMLLGLETITSGTILFEGADLSRMRGKELFALRRRVQPVFQNPYSSLDPRYTVARTIAEPLAVHQVGDAAGRRARVLELLDQVALSRSTADRYPHELSGGQRQRVAIARALALHPDLVVLDEAVSALDVLVQSQILDLLASLQRDMGLTYLFISHDLAVVKMISDQVHVMRAGVVVESGTPDEIFDHATHPYTQELLAAIPGRRVAHAGEPEQLTGEAVAAGDD
ncbi:MAG: ABC transporter ATP-binding protein [Actinobacteria bacterium]|nr:ABC transporter ATP-binding protein [Actinomycetota bacterium]